jgi:oligoribonuclease
VIDRLVWIDCEMTGLDIRQDALVEIAVLVTDSELNIIDEGLDIVIESPPEALAGMPEVVRQMHTASGLLAAVQVSTTSLEQAGKQVLDYIQTHVPERRRAPLCGNSIATDRAFLARDMPGVDDWLHYRMIDVSSIKELCRRWYPRVYYNAPVKNGGHRALADIRESIEELHYYRSAIFVPPPGPDAATARAMAGGPVPAEPEAESDGSPAAAGTLDDAP